MDDDYRELAHRLFAAATAMLEDAIEAAVLVEVVVDRGVYGGGRAVRSRK